MTSRPMFMSTSPVFTVDDEDRGELARDLVFLQVEESTNGLKNLRARFGGSVATMVVIPSNCSIWTDASSILASRSRLLSAR